MLFSWAAARAFDAFVERPGIGTSKSILVADIARAFFEAPAKRDVCVDLPEEALRKGEKTLDTVGKLLASLYGTRNA